MIFLLMIQLTRAIGGKGVIPPDFAAWIPGVDLRVHGTGPARPSAHLSGPNADLARDVAVPGRPAHVDQVLPARHALLGRRSSATSGCAAYFARDIGRGFGDPATYLPETLRQMKNIGVDSMPLTVIVAAFIGGVIALPDALSALSRACSSRSSVSPRA